MIKILVVQPDKEPYIAEIEPNTEGISRFIHGEIVPIYLDSVSVLLSSNEDKFLKPNRFLKIPGKNNSSVLLYGTFIIAGLTADDNIKSLSEDKIEIYKKSFACE